MQVYKEKKEEISRLLNFEERLLDPSEWIFNTEVDEDLHEQVDQAAFIARDAKKRALNFSQYLAVWALLFFSISVALFFKRPDRYQKWTLTLGFIAIVALVNGVKTPMLEITAFMEDLTIPLKLEMLGMSISKDFLFEGRMYFYYQNKSVIDVIGILFQERNYIVGVSIVVFSFLIPLIKLTATLIMALTRQPRPDSLLVKIVGSIGKWSMADVFVAAAFLSYLGFSNMNTGVQTESRTLIGLYFFFSYVLLSIVSGIFCGKALQSETRLQTEDLT